MLRLPGLFRLPRRTCGRRARAADRACAGPRSGETEKTACPARRRVQHFERGLRHGLALAPVAVRARVPAISLDMVEAARKPAAQVVGRAGKVALLLKQFGQHLHARRRLRRAGLAGDLVRVESLPVIMVVWPG